MAFSNTHEGLQIIALETKTGRGLIKDEIYTITNVINGNHADINSTGVGIHSSHEGLFWDFVYIFVTNLHIFFRSFTPSK